MLNLSPCLEFFPMGRPWWIADLFMVNSGVFPQTPGFDNQISYILKKNDLSLSENSWLIRSALIDHPFPLNYILLLNTPTWMTLKDVNYASLVQIPLTSIFHQSCETKPHFNRKKPLQRTLDKPHTRVKNLSALAWNPLWSAPQLLYVIRNWKQMNNLSEYCDQGRTLAVLHHYFLS